MEVSSYDLDPGVDMPSDAQRIQRIKWLVDEGYGQRVTVGHDIHTKHRLVSSNMHSLNLFCHTLV